MEEDDPDAPAVFPQWALLEYGHMLTLLGPGTTCHFTSLSKASLHSLQLQLDKVAQPRADFELHTASFTNALGVPLSSICLLDPQAPLGLSVSDAGLYSAAQQSEASGGSSSSSASPADSQELPGGPFSHFLFGGILGDDPPRDRTSSLRKLGMPRRHLSGMQMTTDTALGVTCQVVERGKGMALDKTEQIGPNGALQWCHAPELNFGNGESVSMPFRYMVDPKSPSANPRPLMPPGMKELIRSDMDRAFEF
ncbi:SAM-dependent RNA methyltransferase, predicted [Ceraceosorus bombacis]|uniref:SAM-dependent RNA methyltransferase, predicted n=1 Tax=Ceraceosorus bombacis TaxID=401625 RepID=A0A0P1BC14_9BASI|nr:SAM-dependent RNA methyltransferase, predicted [Ceraceosorus bombacis]